MAKIKIKANGDEHEVEENLKIADFLLFLKLNPKRSLVELNKKPLKFSDFENLSLKDGDTLEIFSIVAGG